MKYIEKLKDPRWQKKRLEILERDNWACQRCGDDQNTLHVHHRIYHKGKDPWDIESEFLVTLCAVCHEEESIYWQDLESDIVKIFKEKFLAVDVHTIMNGFIKIHIVQHPEVTASILAWALSDKNTMEDLYDKYFEHISKK